MFGVRRNEDAAEGRLKGSPSVVFLETQGYSFYKQGDLVDKDEVYSRYGDSIS